MQFADATDTIRGGKNASRRSEIDVLILLSTTWFTTYVLTNNDTRILVQQSFNYSTFLAITSSGARGIQVNLQKITCEVAK